MPRILVIEDDPIYREMMSDLLDEEGHEVHLAESGTEGIDKARAYVPDLIVSDVVMEGADGYQVLSTLRNEPSTAGIAFIMITGWSTQGGHRQGMAMGADDYLSKPFNATELLDAVNAQLRKKRQVSTRVTQQTSLSETAFGVLLPAEIGKSIQSLHGYAHVLTRRQQQLAADEIQSIGYQLEHTAWRIQRAIDNISLYHRLTRMEQNESGHRHLRKSRTDHVQDFIQTRALNYARWRGRSDDLHLDLRDGRADIGTEYFGRLLDELLDNAFKFSRPGEQVSVVSAFSANRFGLAVSDRGRGMTREQVARIDAFVQFGRYESETTGLGLGLAIARKIAFLHGGSLSIKSSAGEKTRISVELPLQ